MPRRAATSPGVTAFDRRAVPTDYRRAVCRTIGIGVGTVTTAGTIAGTAAVAAAWMVSTALNGPPHFKTTPLALEMAALSQSGSERIITAFADLAAAPVRSNDAAAPAPPAVETRAAEAEFHPPLPRPRTEPSVQAQREAAAAPRTWLAKLFAPQQPSEASGVSPDGHTAIYDIVAHTVYMPDGMRLEAHSGLGGSMDDPRAMRARARGPTPPNVYNLVLRDGLFHGVQAIRMNPVDDAKMFGRAGILAHPYMLGPSGQSFGCVSFKNYAEFLQAFEQGKVDRMIVVTHLPDRDERRLAVNEP
jgi:type VI secretion system (T6SS) effector TldE1-like protein